MRFNCTKEYFPFTKLINPHSDRNRSAKQFGKVHINRIEKDSVGLIIQIIMSKNKKIAIALIAAAVVLAIFGFIALPENVVTQFSTSGDVNKMGKIPALAIPFLITTVFSVLSMNLEEGDERSKKYIMGAVLGILLFFIMIGVNL